ncbi:hypothetical protein ACJX0J_030572, partial [Zea mays]
AAAADLGFSIGFRPSKKCPVRTIPINNNVQKKNFLYIFGNNNGYPIQLTHMMSNIFFSYNGDDIATNNNCLQWGNIDGYSLTIRGALYFLMVIMS